MEELNTPIFAQAKVEYTVSLLICYILICLMVLKVSMMNLNYYMVKRKCLYY